MGRLELGRGPASWVPFLQTDLGPRWLKVTRRCRPEVRDADPIVAASRPQVGLDISNFWSVSLFIRGWIRFGSKFNPEPAARTFKGRAPNLSLPSKARSCVDLWEAPYPDRCPARAFASEVRTAGSGPNVLPTPTLKTRVTDLKSEIHPDPVVVSALCRDLS